MRSSGGAPRGIPRCREANRASACASCRARGFTDRLDRAVEQHAAHLPVLPEGMRDSGKVLRAEVEVEAVVAAVEALGEGMGDAEADRVTAEGEGGNVQPQLEVVGARDELGRRLG